MVEINEGCLSVPDLRGNVIAHVNVRVRSLDRDGGEHDEVKRGLTAGTFQHECDHLDGMLFLDRVHDTRTLTTWEQFERHPPRRVRGPHHRVRPPGRFVTTSYWCELAWLGGDTVTAGVSIDVDGDRITAVRPAVTEPPPTATRLAGLTLPGLANAHSHAFHRALRGAHPDRRRLVLDVARADVRGGRAADAGLVPPARHGGVRRDGARRHHVRRRVPLRPPRTRAACRTTTRTRWARR